MFRRIIDLTLTMKSADSWIEFPRKIVYGNPELPTRIEAFVKPPKGMIYRIETTSQSFTHIDAPKHFSDHSGPSVDEIPLEKLIGEAVIIDMTHKKPKETVTAEDLESSGVEVKEGDIVIIRTGWTDRAWGTKEFWVKMIGMSSDAGDWLLSKGIKALATDFRMDLPPLDICEKCGAMVPRPNQDENRGKFFERGIMMIEWCTNLGAIKKRRVDFICLPLKFEGADGSPVRVIAIEEE